MSCCQKTNTFAGAVLQKAAHGVSGLAQYAAGIGQARPEIIAKRRQICAPCEQNSYGFCIKCRCFLAAKTTIAAEECPLNRWPVP